LVDVAFAMTSLVFFPIALEVHIEALVHSWLPVLIAIGASGSDERSLTYWLGRVICWERKFLDFGSM
jgi:hypothetical protein